MSQEQRAVLDCIRAGHNVVVDACAGSGKSTTILSIAKELTGKKILQFTYNSMLRHEVKEKVKDLGLHNLQVHTYHSFAVNYYSDLGHTDTGIRHILRENIAPRIPIPLVDLVVYFDFPGFEFL
jgi:superfamily I DNA/RNA helicase